MENEGDGDTSCYWCTQNHPQRIGKGTGRLGNQRTSGNHPDYCIIMIGQNREKSPGDLSRLAVTQTPVRKMCNACNEKWQTTSNSRNGTTKSRQD